MNATQTKRNQKMKKIDASSQTINEIRFSWKHGHDMKAKRAGFGFWLVGKADKAGTFDRVSDAILQAWLDSPQTEVTATY